MNNEDVESAVLELEQAGLVDYNRESGYVTLSWRGRAIKAEEQLSELKRALKTLSEG